LLSGNSLLFGNPLPPDLRPVPRIAIFVPKLFMSFSI
jgi:hypothetical protein